MLTNRLSFRATLHVLASALLRIAGSRQAERGVASFIAALIVLVTTGATVATITLTEDDLDFGAIEDVIEGSVQRVSGTMELRGSVIARSDDGVGVSTIELPLRLYGEGSAVSFDADDPGRLFIAYHDSEVYEPDVSYGYRILSGNGDELLDPGETALITIDLAALLTEESGQLIGGERFTLEVSAPVGGNLIVERRMPAILQPIMSLY